MNAAGDGWECVQDPLLARAPRPERLPQPSAPPDQRTDSAGEAPSEPPLPDDPLPPAGPMPPPDDTALPEHARLTVGMSDPPALAEVPGHYYAVQLIAMPSAAALQNFADGQNLTDTTSVMVEREGQLFHVLLLGIYEDAATARRAVASLPPDLRDAEPWIRRISSLQSASMRANAVAGSEGLL